MEPWDGLDIDESDLPSLLRPCKRRHQTPGNQTTSDSQPILSPSSHRLQSPPSQTLDSYSRPFASAPSPTTSSRLIPGPAGIVQAAMLRKTRDNQNFSSDDPPIPTQEYIRRAVEDAEEDNDFKNNPWLCAIKFVSSDGTVDSVLPCTPLSSIKKCLNFSKIDQVVAIIKSCTPNGFGDLIVTLKDPTGTVGASIHHKVLTEGEFAKNISVGSVLILQKVAFFSPSRSQHYLNITLSNVVKVIHKDTGPPLEKNYPASAVKYAAPECVEKTMMFQKAFCVDRGRTEGSMNDEMRQNGNARGSLHIDSQKDKSNIFSGSGHHGTSDSSRNLSSSINRNAGVGKLESFLLRQDAAKDICKAGAIGMEITEGNREGALDSNDKWPKGGNFLLHSSVSENLVENYNDMEIQIGRQPLILRASLPQWTDEQLNELFAWDCEDDHGALF